MQKKRWVRAIVLAAVWGYVASVWASIAHHLTGLPDLTPLLASAAVVVVMGWTFRARTTAVSGGPTVPLTEQAAKG
jgi:hypothetical protein